MYSKLCEALVDSGYQSYLFRDYPKSVSAPDKPRLFLRHDVDSMPPAAVELAKIESELGLKSTFFFRCVRSAFDPDVIETIHEMGMEVGYHYETLDRADGIPQRAIEITKDDLKRLRQIAPVTTVAMHGNPLTPYDNRDLWKYYDYHDLGIKLEAYEIISDKLKYFTDTGRNWDETRGNMLDMGKTVTEIRLTDTPSLIRYVQKNIADVCISAHPNRWSSQPLIWSYNLAYDTTGNIVKGLLKLVRK